MKNSWFLFLSQYRVFWRLRSLGYKVFFWIGALVFRYQYHVREKTDNYVGLRHLFQITQVQLMQALLFAILLQLVDPIIYDFYGLTFLQIPDDSDYVTFLVTISGIGGVLLVYIMPQLALLVVQSMQKYQTIYVTFLLRSELVMYICTSYHSLRS